MNEQNEQKKEAKYFIMTMTIYRNEISIIHVANSSKQNSINALIYI